jgi:hypothetical protein
LGGVLSAWTFAWVFSWAGWALALIGATMANINMATIMAVIAFVFIFVLLNLQ